MTTIIESKYENIRDECLAAGKLWEDPNFPADGTSIGPNPKTVKPKWRRPHEVCDKMGIPPPEFIIEGGDRFDINQGGLADCWMLAAVASITSSPQLFKRVVPHDQTFQMDKYAGVFRFHFWQFGKWVEVLVDDRLPMAYGELLYVKSKTPNEFWAPLLEKAYAKLYGSYQVIECGMCDEALVDFTGALAQHFSLEELTPKDLAGIMFKASERNSIISSTVQDPECAEKKGLVARHSYSITGVKKEICQEFPEFIIDGGGRFDINQGSLGDCWMLASLASLTMSPQLFERAVPHDQTFKKDKYAGIFRFNFYKYGKWVEVLIDDRLPMADGKLKYVTSKQPNEFWGALLEKAYAKFYGNYQIIEGGLCEDAFVDFTGCLAHSISLEDFTPKDLAKILYPAAERQSILSACVGEPNSAKKKGLPTRHAYSITGVKKITLENNVQRNLIRIRNPWGNKKEWTGRWSDTSEGWDKISVKTRQELGLVKNDDGEFWIQFSDFLRNFRTLEICYLDVADIFDIPEGPKCWSTSLFYGRWTKNQTAGGQDVNSPSFAKNPQFAITVTDCDEDDDKASFVVELTQMNRRRLMLKRLKIGFYLYSILPETKLPLSQEFLQNNKYTVGKDHYEWARAVATDFTKTPGTYVIIPTTKNEDDEGEFMLRVFSETDHESHAINE